MLTNDCLSDWFKDLSKIIFDTKISIDNIRRITHPEDDIEEKVLKHGFFSHCYRQSRFTIIVQLCKIFNKTSNQKRNFYKLFNRLSIDKYDKTITDILKENESSNHAFANWGNLERSGLFTNRVDIVNEINSLMSEIEIQKGIIERILVLRDGQYAHSDPDSRLPNVSNQELEILINLAIKIYNNLYGKFYDTTLVFAHTIDWKIDYPIKALAKIRRERLK